jgi:hypothetical protein
MSAHDPLFEAFVNRLRNEMADYAGRPEYGYLRYKTDVWEMANGNRITNLAIVYDTPGGSTNQVNVSLDRGTGLFALIDEEERLTADPEEALAWILPHVQAVAAIWRGAPKPPSRRATVH